MRQCLTWKTLKGAGEIKMSRLLFIILMVFSVPSAFASSVPKLGNSCPSGYRIDGSSGYCTPSSSSNPALQVVRKLTNSCPAGYRPDGSSGYCIQSSLSSPAPRVLPKSGNNCPSGFRTDGSSGYCTAK
jgi:hypothetical protein